MQSRRVYSLCFFCSVFLFLFAIFSCSAVTEEVIERHPNGVKKVVYFFQSDSTLTSIKTYHFNSIRATETTIQNTLPHGPFTSWSSSGTLMVTGLYNTGKKEGVWQEWYDGQHLFKTGRYHNDNKIGVWEARYPSGSLQQTTEYSEGTQSGPVIQYFPNGSFKSIDSCYQKTTASFSEYYSNGTLRQRYHCRAGLPVGSYLMNFATGSIKKTGRYSDGHLDSLWTTYFESGAIHTKYSYTQGVRNGLYQIFTPTGDTLVDTLFKNGAGRIKLRCAHDVSTVCADSTWRNNQLHGAIVAYDTLQRLKTISYYINGEKLSEKKYRKGHLVLEGGFKDNLRAGEWRLYYPDGTPRSILNFNNDRYLGQQLFFDSTGRLTMKRNYKGKGKEVQVEFVY